MNDIKDEHRSHEGPDEHHHEHHHTRTIETTVLYVGHEDFHAHFSPAEEVHGVKLRAMHHFGIEPASDHKYALQEKGADLPEKEHLSKLHEHCVTLTLVLKQEVPKG